MNHYFHHWIFAALLPLFSLILVQVVHHRLMCRPAATSIKSTNHIATNDSFRQSSLNTYYSDYRLTSPFDPGSFRVFVRNREAQPIRITEVRVDGFTVPVWGVDTSLTTLAAQDFTDDDFVAVTPKLQIPLSAGGASILQARRDMAHQQILWARLRPAVIEPGAVAECVVKLRAPAIRPAKLSLITDSALVHDVVLRPVARDLSISAVTFTPDLGTMHVFVANTSPLVMELDRCEIDGVTVAADISPRTVASSMKAVISVRPPHPFRQGAFHTVCVVSNDGVATVERVRVFTGFPLATESRNEAVRGFGLDMWPCASLPNNYSGLRPPGPWINVIFECVMHKYGADLTRTAQQVFYLYDAMLAADPFHPNIIHPCRVRLEEGCAKFGEIADAIRINPFVHGDAPVSGNSTYAHNSAWYLGSLASAGTAPRPWYALISTGEPSCDSPQALRRLGYAAIATGAKGLFFRHVGWTHKPDDEISRALRDWIAEIGLIRDWLAEADVVPAIESMTLSRLSAATLLSPGRGMVLVIVNQPGDSPADSQVEVDIQWPFGAAPVDLLRIAPAGLSETRVYTPVDGKQLRLTVPVPADAAAYIISSQRSEP